MCRCVEDYMPEPPIYRKHLIIITAYLYLTVAHSPQVHRRLSSALPTTPCPGRYRTSCIPVRRHRPLDRRPHFTARARLFTTPPARLPTAVPITTSRPEASAKTSRRMRRTTRTTPRRERGSKSSRARARHAFRYAGEGLKGRGMVLTPVPVAEIKVWICAA